MLEDNHLKFSFIVSVNVLNKIIEKFKSYGYFLAVAVAQNNIVFWFFIGIVWPTRLIDDDEAWYERRFMAYGNFVKRKKMQQVQKHMI